MNDRLWLRPYKHTFPALSFLALSLLSLSLLACLLTGCASSRLKEANAVARQGSEAANTLETYYANLVACSEAFQKINFAKETQGAAVIDRLTPGDLIGDRQDPAHVVYLAGRLKAPHDDVDRFFQGLLSAPTRQLLVDYDGVSAPTRDLNQAIVDDLNTHLLQDAFYAQYAQLADNPLSKVKLNESAQVLLDQYLLIGEPTLTITDANGQPVVIDKKNQRKLTLNRLILDCAYPALLRPTLSERFERQQSALRARLALAHTLKGMTDALQKLTGSDASDAVRDAAQSLQTEIETVNHHPLALASPNPLVEKAIASVDSKTFLADMARRLAEIQQVHAFRKNLPSVDGFLVALQGLFENEKIVYVLITAQYLKEIGIQDLQKINDPSVTVVTSVEPKAFDAYGIPVVVTPSAMPVDQATARQDAALRIEQATYRKVTAAEDEADRISRQLLALHLAFTAFLQRNNIAPPATVNSVNTSAAGNNAAAQTIRP